MTQITIEVRGDITV